MGGKHSQHQAYAQVVRTQRDEDITKWHKLMAQRRKDLNISQQLEQQIYLSTAHELAQMLNQGQATSRQILTVFAYRATTVAKHFNYITELDFEAADTAAIACDEHRKRTGKKNMGLTDPWDSQRFFPPLYGVPTSVKDNIDQKGKRTTIGVTTRAHQIKERDSGIVACLRQAGMIPFIRTNCSQTTMATESSNFLYGRSLNIWNNQRSVGGSSGGEAGMLASFCTPIGVGTDIGGSVRGPAAFNGLCSLKPCEQRLSTSTRYFTEYPDMFYGKTSVISVIGPMARSVQDLALWMKTACHQQLHTQSDYFHRTIDFDADLYNNQTKKKLRIGYVKSYSIIEASPASQRAVQEVVALLKGQGHQLVPVEIPNLQQTVEQYLIWFNAEGGFKAMKQILQGEKESPYLKTTRLLSESRVLSCIAQTLLKYIAPRMHIFLKHIREISTAEFSQHNARVHRLRHEFCDWFKAQGLDHIVTPDFGHQANPFSMTEELVPCAFYTCIWNLLNMPAGALPVTLVREDEQHYESQTNDMLTSLLRQSATGSAGLPVGVQIVALPFEEEKILAVMRSVEEQINFQRFRKPPQVPSNAE